MPMKRENRMAMYLNQRVRITLNDSRKLIGTFLSYDKYMNALVADCEEYRILDFRTARQREEKRLLGFMLLRGERIVSLQPEPHRTVLESRPRVHTHSEDPSSGTRRDRGPSTGTSRESRGPTQGYERPSHHTSHGSDARSTGQRSGMMGPPPTPMERGSGRFLPTGIPFPPPGMMRDIAPRRPRSHHH